MAQYFKISGKQSLSFDDEKSELFLVQPVNLMEKFVLAYYILIGKALPILIIPKDYTITYNTKKDINHD